MNKPTKQISTENLKNEIKSLKAGDRILLSGTVYTARDAAHKKIIQLINEGGKLPFDIKGSVIYYSGPTPAPKGLVIGSCGPTTSSRMDVYTPKLVDLGLLAMIGKGPRNSQVVDAIKRNGAIYFCATGGAGALASKCIKSCEVVAFEELACESVKKLHISSFPLYVAIDSFGNSLFNK